MASPHSRRERVLLKALAIVLSLVVLVAVIWIDVLTGFWQEIVILSGLAAGLLTFFLTAFFFDRWIARADHKRWTPVTRLALSDLLHALADEERSEPSRGLIHPREISSPAGPSREALDRVLHDVLDERALVTDALSRWAGFLVASADVQTLMTHFAALGGHLDAVRDTAVEVENGHAEEFPELLLRVEDYNRLVAAAVSEISAVLQTLSTGEESDTAPRSGHARSADVVK